MSRLFLLLFAGLKFSKLFWSVGSMVLTLGLYAMMYGWRYGAGLIAMLLLHELGHYIAARQRKIAVGLPMFLPFVAFVSRGRVPNAETASYIALGGPMLGTVAAIGAYYLGQAQDSQLLLAIAYAGFFINLVNLIPLPPLDGGAITEVLSPRIWLLGVPVLGMMMWYRFSPVLVIIAICALPYVMRALRRADDSPQARAYYAVSERTRWEYAVLYIGLLAYLGLMVHDVDRQLHRMRNEPQEQGESI